MAWKDVSESGHLILSSVLIVERDEVHTVKAKNLPRWRSHRNALKKIASGFHQKLRWQFVKTYARARRRLGARGKGGGGYLPMPPNVAREPFRVGEIGAVAYMDLDA